RWPAQHTELRIPGYTRRDEGMLPRAGRTRTGPAKKRLYVDYALAHAVFDRATRSRTTTSAASQSVGGVHVSPVGCGNRHTRLRAPLVHAPPRPDHRRRQSDYASAP